VVEDTYYVTNAELIEEINTWKDRLAKAQLNGESMPGISDKLAIMIMKIAKNLAKKGQFNGYTYKDDMISEAILTNIKYLQNFNSDKSKNPFAYITQICYNAFVQYINKEKKQAFIKETCYDRQDTIKSASSALTGIDYTIMKVNDIDE